MKSIVLGSEVAFYAVNGVAEPRVARLGKVLGAGPVLGDGTPTVHLAVFGHPEFDRASGMKSVESRRNVPMLFTTGGSHGAMWCEPVSADPIVPWPAPVVADEPVTEQATAEKKTGKRKAEPVGT